MKKLYLILLLPIWIFVQIFPQSVYSAANSTINVVPKPNHLVERKGHFVVKNDMSLLAPSKSGAASLLTSKLETAAGIHLKSATSVRGADFVLSIDTTAVQGAESYRLSVTTSQVSIKAATETGLYYGVQTLLQLLPPQIESTRLAEANWVLPSVNIDDSPQFAYRGIMLDVCRHFLPADHIKKLLDVLAMYKINRFHWHLTDDQGWRIEIKRYPELTKIGSSRKDANGNTYSGYYTQDQIKDIVKYAAARHIVVIPEIEMPGHALAALSAYPQYSCTGGPFKPRTVWGVENNVYCAGNDSTFAFLSNVLDEVCALFPSKYIHIGGDECPKVRWESCPKGQARMKEEGLKNVNELQSYFIKRMEKILEQKGRKIIGWDEILEGGIAPSATIMSWRGEEGGIEAANAGHDVIMTPGSALYLDHYQGSPLCEPVKIGGLTTLQQIYAYHPIPKEINPKMAHHVLGLQGNLWSEYLYQPNQFDYQLFPRALAVAETGWTHPDLKNVKDFIRRIDDQQIRLDEHQINYYIPMPEGNLNHMEFTDSLRLAFTTNRPVQVVYTEDGSTPTQNSKAYKGPIVVTKTTTLKLCSVLPQGKMSPVRTIHLVKTEPMPSMHAVHLQQGLRLKYTGEGYYKYVSQLESVKNWQDTVISLPNQLFKLIPVYNDGKSIAGEPQGAGIISGYLQVDKAGLYQVHCNADELLIGDQLLINNDGKMKKSVPTDITVPLEAGYYPFQMTILNNVWGGFPSSWADFRIQLREWKGNKSSAKLNPVNLYYRK